MENSILNSVKKLLGVSDGYTAFDLDIIIHINSAFSTLSQLGIGPVEGIAIEDSSATWDVLNLSTNQLQSMVKTYVYLKSRMGFDPPATSFHIEAMNKQIEEQEWRLREMRELIFSADSESFVIDGGDI